MRAKVTQNSYYRDQKQNLTREKRRTRKRYDADQQKKEKEKI